MDRSVEFAIGAAVLACEDANLDLDKANLDRCGTVVGTGIGGIDSIHEVYETLFDKGPGRVSPFAVPMMIANMTSARVSIRLGLKGPVIYRRNSLYFWYKCYLAMHSVSFNVVMLM